MILLKIQYVKTPQQTIAISNNNDDADLTGRLRPLTTALFPLRYPTLLGRTAIRHLRWLVVSRAPRHQSSQSILHQTHKAWQGTFDAV
jgi:hypothetical protein